MTAITRRAGNQSNTKFLGRSTLHTYNYYLHISDTSLLARYPGGSNGHAWGRQHSCRVHSIQHGRDTIFLTTRSMARFGVPHFRHRADGRIALHQSSQDLILSRHICLAGWSFMGTGSGNMGTGSMLVTDVLQWRWHHCLDSWKEGWFLFLKVHASGAFMFLRFSSSHQRYHDMCGGWAAFTRLIMHARHWACFSPRSTGKGKKKHNERYEWCAKGSALYHKRGSEKGEAQNKKRKEDWDSTTAKNSLKL
jgi:hypothetical protein